jgi:signal transduction histidine kinase
MNFYKLLDRFIPNDFRNSSELEFRARILVALTAVMGIILWLGLFVIVIIFPEYAVTKITLIIFDFSLGLLCLLGLWVFFKTKSFVLGSLPCLLTVAGVVFFGGMENGSLKAPVVPLIFVLPLLVQFFTGDRRIRAFVFGFCLIILLGLRLLEVAGMTKPFVILDPSRHSTVLLIVYSLICTIAYGISSVYDRARRDAEERVSQLAKISSLDLISGGFAHEVNSSLAAIVLSADYILKQSNSESMSSENIKKVADRTKRAAAKISAVVKAVMTRRNKDHSSRVSESTARIIVDEALILCETTLDDSKISVSVEGDLDLMISACRPQILSQVLFSLVQNSQEALAELSEKWIKISVRQLGEAVEFSVTDSGRGVPDAVRERLFMPFYTTKEVGDGYGLGLVNCASAIALQGGQLEYVASAKNTTFAFRVPLVLVTL